jgi:hypothetical protein
VGIGTRVRGAAAALALLAGTVGAGDPAGAAGPVPCGARASVAITSAFREVLDRSGPLAAAERAVHVGAGSSSGSDRQLVSLIADWLATPHGNTETVAFGAVRCRGRRATVEYQVVYAGTPLPTDLLPPGRARRIDGSWRMTLATLCERVALTDPRRGTAAPCR